MPKDKYSLYVEHPRFGKGPRRTGLNVESNLMDTFLHWHPGRITNTAILADTNKQLPATVPVTHYFDLKRICRKCTRPFIFFAEEQKYWYEELKLPLEADAVCCVPCRRQVQELQKLKSRYDQLCHAERSTSETYEMVEAALHLVDQDIFQREVLKKLKGILRKIPLPEQDGTRLKIITDKLSVLNH